MQRCLSFCEEGEEFMIEMIKSRRSCRSYTEEKVKEEDLKEIVECGLLAPSGMNTQGIQLCVITDEEVLAQLEKLMGRDFFYHAPALIVVYSDPDNKYAAYDGSCAMAQMYLAAHALGLGSCWINQLKDVTDDPKFEPLFDKLSLKGKIIVGALAVGHANKAPEERQIKEGRAHWFK